MAEPDQVADRLSSQPLGINGLEHGPVLLLLAVLMVHQEGDGARTSTFSKVAQVHERAAREVGEVCIAEPDKEASRALFEEARIVLQDFGATEAAAQIEDDLGRGLRWQATHDRRHWLAQIG